MQMQAQSHPQARAQATLATSGVASDVNEYLAFRLTTQEYAVDIMDVQEIRNYEQPTRIDGAPDFVLGVLNLRGMIIPVLDLRLRLGLPASFDGQTVTMVMSLATGTVGVVVDTVSDVLELQAGEIQALPPQQDAADSGLFQGLGRTRHLDEERTLIVMNFLSLMPRGTAV